MCQPSSKRPSLLQYNVGLAATILRLLGQVLVNGVNGQVPTVRLNRCLIPQDERVADTLTVGAFFVAVIPGCLTQRTFVPISYFSSNRVNAVAALFAVDFGTATVCDRQVVTSTATL